MQTNILRLKVSKHLSVQSNHIVCHRREEKNHWLKWQIETALFEHQLQSEKWLLR